MGQNGLQIDCIYLKVSGSKHQYPQNDFEKESMKIEPCSSVLGTLICAELCIRMT